MTKMQKSPLLFLSRVFGSQPRKTSIIVNKFLQFSIREHCRETHNNREFYNKYRHKNKWDGKHGFLDNHIFLFLSGEKDISYTCGFLAIA